MQIIQQGLVFILLILSALSQSCLDKNNQEIDWWFILKMPSSRQLGWSGLDYFYCDSKNNCDEFNLQQDDLNSEKSPLILTVRTINFTDTNVITMLWNDQPNEKEQYPRNAHSKGMLRAGLNGNNKAFIISHSSPRFPKLNDEGEIDKDVDTNFLKHGQHFLCLSTTTQDINNQLADLYLEAEINIHKVSSTPSKASKFSDYNRLNELWNSKKVLKGSYTYNKSPELNKKLTFNTRAGQFFQVFSKNENFQKDFYAEVIAPNLEQDFILESWVRQYKKAGVEDPECEKEFHTSSNEEVEYKGKKNGIDMTFNYKYTKDHSKYGITLPKESGLPLAGASFIETSHYSLKGQIFASNQHSRKREIQSSIVDETTTDTDKTMEVSDGSSEKEGSRKRKRERDDNPALPKRRKIVQEKQVCISDLNRQRSQWERGGLVYCFYNEGLWNHINKAFIKKKDCKDD